MPNSAPHTVFYVSNGNAMCPDCFDIVYPDSTTDEAKHYTPVMSDGTGDDHHGLICDCGETINFIQAEVP